jgi:NAD(P)-dependent dehydrogenase (short-subunit alcohol dehydrogenase family)
MTVRYDFSGRTAFVTGGTAGIGRACALAFARAGADVTIAARGREAGQRTCEALTQAGAQALFVQTDVRDSASVADAVARTVERFGRLDFAANCAGSGGDMAPLESATQAVWDDEISAMLEGGGGAIVNMSSIYGAAGKVAHHAYVASKHAVLGMTRSVALEYATRGVRVNAVCAGVTRTEAMDRAEAAVPAIVGALVAEHPMQRMATEDEIAAAILWLCSSDSGFVTGAPLHVDGGFLAA